MEKYQKWEDNATYSTYFYNVNNLFKIKDNIIDDEYIETSRLVYKINIKRLEIKYLDQSVFNCFDPELGWYIQFNCTSIWKIT